MMLPINQHGHLIPRIRVYLFPDGVVSCLSFSLPPHPFSLAHFHSLSQFFFLLNIQPLPLLTTAEAAAAHHKFIDSKPRPLAVWRRKKKPLPSSFSRSLTLWEKVYWDNKSIIFIHSTHTHTDRHQSHSMHSGKIKTSILKTWIMRPLITNRTLFPTQRCYPY